MQTTEKVLKPLLGSQIGQDVYAQGQHGHTTFSFRDCISKVNVKDSNSEIVAWLMKHA